MRIKLLKTYIFLLIFTLLGGEIEATELNIAVASNFQLPAEQIKKLFEANSKDKLNIISGSSGKHYAQIINGAPFDIFMAADSSYIKKLEEQNLNVPGTKWQYARGKLALVVKPKKDLDKENLKKLFAENKLFTSVGFKGLQFTHLAIANPDLAPYGRAAREVLEAIGIYQDLKSKIVVGENIQQAHQFVASGNAEIGFLSLAQVINTDELYFSVPEKLYAPILQEVVVLKSKNGSDVKSEAAKAFIEFLKTERVKKLIQSFGYETL